MRRTRPNPPRRLDAFAAALLAAAARRSGCDRFWSRRALRIFGQRTRYSARSTDGGVSLKRSVRLWGGLGLWAGLTSSGATERRPDRRVDDQDHAGRRLLSLRPRSLQALPGGRGGVLSLQGNDGPRDDRESDRFVGKGPPRRLRPGLPRSSGSYETCSVEPGVKADLAASGVFRDRGEILREKKNAPEPPNPRPPFRLDCRRLSDPPSAAQEGLPAPTRTMELSGLVTRPAGQRRRLSVGRVPHTATDATGKFRFADLKSGA
jgi:hypothetical protein